MNNWDLYGSQNSPIQIFENSISMGGNCKLLKPFLCSSSINFKLI